MKTKRKPAAPAVAMLSETDLRAAMGKIAGVKFDMFTSIDYWIYRSYPCSIDRKIISNRIAILSDWTDASNFLRCKRTVEWGWGDGPGVKYEIRAVIDGYQTPGLTHEEKAEVPLGGWQCDAETGVPTAHYQTYLNRWLARKFVSKFVHTRKESA